MSMALCQKDVTPLLTHWSYVFLALTHQCDIPYSTSLTPALPKSEFVLTKDTSYLALTSKLWSVYCKDFEKSNSVIKHCSVAWEWQV